jgi:hypothetical protein
MNAIPAAAPGQKYVPAFTVTKLDGTFTKRVAKMVPTGHKDKNGNQRHTLEWEEVERPKGWLVTTPRNQGGYARNGSIHIETYEELEALGFTNTEVPIVKPDSFDDPVGSVPNRIRKEKV